MSIKCYGEDQMKSSWSWCLWDEFEIHIIHAEADHHQTRPRPGPGQLTTREIEI